VKLKALHITNWYPRKQSPYAALWIKRHIDSLNPHTENIIYHVEVVKGPFSFSFIEKGIEGNYAYIISLPLQIWLLTEWVNYWIVRYILKREKGKYDIVNFHIAYPLCTYINKIKRLTDKPLVITEHWSAYHFNFGVSKDKELKRVKRIFNQSVPIISVSQALANDIRNFSNGDFDSYVVPNIVDDVVFYPDSTIIRQDFFFMVSLWKWPKRPLVVLNAFKKFLSKFPQYKLRIGGYGPEHENMKLWVTDNKLEQHIEFVGALDSFQIARNLRECRAFIHCTEYETFSVVCAEAVSCHTPVLASNVGGIPEVIRSNEGILVDGMDSLAWEQGLHQILNSKFNFEEENRFSKEVVGELYHQALMNCYNGFGK